MCRMFTNYPFTCHLIILSRYAVCSVFVLKPDVYLRIDVPIKNGSQY
jgi:hypothetical protein